MQHDKLTLGFLKQTLWTSSEADTAAPAEAAPAKEDAPEAAPPAEEPKAD